MLAWLLLVASLSAPVGLAQFRPGDYRAESDQDRAEIEYERSRQRQAAYELRRALAHARLGAAASTIEPQTLCPATVSPGDGNPTFGKRALQPLTPRSALRPTTARWSDVAPASRSAAGIFSEYISEQVVQSRCINCHMAGGVSGHTRLVLFASTVDGHEALNLAVFENLTATIEGATDLILNKIQGVAHGGGIQVPAGSADFANMERFLRLLGGESSAGSGLSPETLFNGVTMASPGKTLRRAALIFAGRLPTQTELNSVRNANEASLRRTIRNLMAGPKFHDFLLRASNDRLLTDKLVNHVFSLTTQKFFVDLVNIIWEARKAAYDRGYKKAYLDPENRHVQPLMYYGVARAPLELIAHVAENDLPYTEILTADYIMANPLVARAYGAASTTEFDDPSDPNEFKPSRIVSYYRNHSSKVTEFTRALGLRILEPGNLITVYPHAGLLNTLVFLQRYPTTATNRNRARSRWTYYHFLGLDIEKSATRTTDPNALADTDNPTMKNPNCTVCHSVMDPVAGAFQNFSDEGYFRNQHGGLDSLPRLYKRPEDGSVSPYQQGDTWYRDMREPGFGGGVAPSADNSLQWLAERIVEDERFAEAAVKFWWPAIMGVEIADPPEDESDQDFEALRLTSSAQHLEVRRLAEAFRTGIAGGRPYNLKDLLTEITLSPWFRADSLTGQDSIRDIALRDAGVERLLTPEELDRKTEAVSGYMWGRRFHKTFGRGRVFTNLNDYRGRTGYGLLYGGIDSDGISERAVDMSPLMAAVAQSHAVEVSCPIVEREFLLWPDGNRRLFDGLDRFDSPVTDERFEFDVSAEDWEARQAFSFQVALFAGMKDIRLRFTNDFRMGEGSDRIDRNLYLDRIEVRGSGGNVVAEIELESVEREQRCGTYWRSHKSYKMWGNCSLAIPVEIPSRDVYSVHVSAFQDQAGDDPARMVVSVESDESSSKGAMAIREKLVELHWKLFGVAVSADSPDVEEAFALFVAAWKADRPRDFRCLTRDDHFYYDGILDEVVSYDEISGYSEVQTERVQSAFPDTIRNSDPDGVLHAWVVTLAYLLMDPRYLLL